MRKSVLHMAKCVGSTTVTTVTHIWSMRLGCGVHTSQLWQRSPVSHIWSIASHMRSMLWQRSPVSHIWSIASHMRSMHDGGGDGGRDRSVTALA
jgi:hypothetical protein